MTVTLKPDLEEELAARAQAQSLTTEEFVNRVLEGLVAQEKSVSELSAEGAGADSGGVDRESFGRRTAAF